jgi:hypothetical protein
MNKHLIVVLAVVLMMLATSATALAGGKDNPRKELGAARAATADFRKIDAAMDARYTLKLPDATGVVFCIENPLAGGMGIHYVNVDLLGTPSVNATTPEVLVYEPRKNGKLRLVALEYVVFQATWEDANGIGAAPPSLFGQEFELIEKPNRYGLDPFYELHAWIWEHNPSGMFDDWNPRVSCRYA